YSISEIETHRVVLKDKFISIFESNEPIEFHDAITTGTSSKIKLEYRVSFLIKIFDEIMG
ncbi:TPA: hypothetical protein ACGF40_003671, partial [Vibrio cholerae]